MVEFMLISEPETKVVLPGDLSSVTVVPQEMDWEREILLIVDLGEKRTGGHSVEIVGVDVGANRLDVVLRVTQPGRGAFVAQVITHPYATGRVLRGQLKPGPVTIEARDLAGNLLGQQEVSL